MRTGRLLSSVSHGEILVQAALVGLLSGLLVILFRIGINLSLSSTVAFMQNYALHIRLLLFPLVGGLGGLIAGFLVYRFAPETSGSGIPYVKMALARMGNATRVRSVLIKFFAGIFGIGTGLSLGREGPSVQLGAGAGALIGRIFRLKGTLQDNLIAAGAGSAIGATFNAPIAGAIFVLEELVNRFSTNLLLPVLTATVCASSLSRGILGNNPAFTLPVLPNFSVSELPAALGLGILAGILGKLFAQTIFAFQKLYLSSHIKPFLRPALAGSIIGIIGCFLPLILGPGNIAADELFRGNIPIKAVFVIFLLKFIATPLCFGSGAAGGIFLPMLMLGAFLGWLCSYLFSFCGLDISPQLFAIMGMAAFLSAVGRTPITAVVMVFEMTGGYSQILPIMLCAALADFTSGLLGHKPIYTMLVMRGQKSGTALALSSMRVKDFAVKNNTVLRLSMSVSEALDIFRSSKVSTLPVSDYKNRLIGTVSRHELEDFLYQGNTGTELLDKVLNPDAEIISPNDDLYSAYYRLHSSGGGALAVVDKHMRIVGMLTRHELSEALLSWRSKHQK